MTQADIDAGSVTNSALASGNPPTGPPVSDTSGTTGGNDTPTTTSIPQTATIALVKTAGAIADIDGNGPDAGDTISYTFTVTNPGTVTVNNVTIDDPLVIAANDGVSNPLTQLAKLETADMMSTASLQAPASTVVTHDVFMPHTDVPAITSGLSVQRRIVRLDRLQTAFKAGDQVGLIFAVTNTGEGPLINIAISQNQSFSLSAQQPYLAAGEQDNSTLVFVYQLTAVDVARGTLALPATATALSRTTKLTVDVSAAIALEDAQNLDDVITASITPAVLASLAPGAAMFG